MRKGIAALGDQIQQDCVRAQEFVAELALSDHPLGETIAALLHKVNDLVSRLGTNSANSNLPPSQDPHREKRSKASGNRKPGGQAGHAGSRLEPVENPDKIVTLKIDAALLPQCAEVIGVKKRQVMDVLVHRFVTEYQAEIYQFSDGTRKMAEFPEGVSADIQYGKAIKALVAYSSAYQLMPYRRIVDMFTGQLRVPMSEGSVYNFLKETSCRLDRFDEWLREQLLSSPLLHVDETGININGKNNWMHTVSTDSLTLLVPHARRGRDAIEEIGILPAYGGLVCHDCWSSYFAYDDVTHVLCNAHIMRELKGAEEKYACHWAKLMYAVFKAMYKVCMDSGGSVPAEVRKKLRARYRNILTRGEKECGMTNESGKQKRTKPQNLLKRLREHEEAVLRFLEDPAIPFTNNLAENALRMAKVQQKISGCFRTMDLSLIHI